MRITDSVQRLPADGARSRVYGEPYRTADGATVIPVSKVGAGSSAPVGVFVIKGDSAQWIAAVDVYPLALIGVVTGLLAAVLGSLAVLRRPPWPDLSATSAAWKRGSTGYGR
jgi:hypothetical protein